MDILIEEAQGSLWAAALDQGKLDGLEVDPIAEEVRWGSIYWAKVKTIDAAIDAVFLDLDGENTGILYNKDTRRIVKDGKIEKGGAKAIGKTYSPGDMIAVQAKTAYLPRDFDSYVGEESKIPEMSMDITLPGRFLIYCPFMLENRVSKRIKDRKLRNQIKKMMEAIEDISGFIARAAGANTQTEMLVREAKILRTAWEELSALFKGAEPGLIMLGPDAVQRSLSDQADKIIDRIEVVTMDHYNHVEEWCSIFAPDLVTKIEPLELDDAADDLALYHYRDIMGQIEDLFQSYVLLPGGGNIIIQPTAALTAVDVNRGGDKRGNLSVNLEAAQEVARQMRLRNIGGIVLVDFMKFQSKKAEGQVIARLEEEINKDPCTVQIHGTTALGLTELTRKRRTPELIERMETDFF